MWSTNSRGVSRAGCRLEARQEFDSGWEQDFAGQGVYEGISTTFNSSFLEPLSPPKKSINAWDAVEDQGHANDQAHKQAKPGGNNQSQDGLSLLSVSMPRRTPSLGRKELTPIPATSALGLNSPRVTLPTLLTLPSCPNWIVQLT
jgi:hypothetical protein